MTRTSSPTVSRRWIALELKRLRHDAGLSQAEVAKVLRCQVPKVSLIESAQRNVQDDDLDELLKLFEVPDSRRQQYLDAAKNGRRKAWWERDEVIPDWLEQYVGLEQGAERIRSYSSAIIHGLLQSEEYTTALLQGSPMESEERVEHLIDVRLHRQKAIYRDVDPLQLAVVMDEAAVLHAVGGNDIMRLQLEHLVQLAGEQPNVVIQLIPFDRGNAYQAAYGNFAILSFPWRNDPGMVYVEHRSGASYLESINEIDIYSRTFDHLQSLALDPDESLTALQKTARAFD